MIFAPQRNGSSYSCRAVEDFGGGRVAKDTAPIFDVAGICQLRIFTRKGSVRKYAEFIFIPVKEQ